MLVESPDPTKEADMKKLYTSPTLQKAAVSVAVAVSSLLMANMRK